MIQLERVVVSGPLLAMRLFPLAVESARVLAGPQPLKTSPPDSDDSSFSVNWVYWYCDLVLYCWLVSCFASSVERLPAATGLRHGQPSWRCCAQPGYYPQLHPRTASCFATMHARAAQALEAPSSIRVLRTPPRRFTIASALQS